MNPVYMSMCVCLCVFCLQRDVLLYKESSMWSLLQLVILAWLSKAWVRRLVMSHEVWRRLAKHPTGEGGPVSRGWNKAGTTPWWLTSIGWVFKSHQLSGFSCVSMSTRQMGHFLLVASHWSTQPWWKRCMQGNLLEDRERRRDTGVNVDVKSTILYCVQLCAREEPLTPGGDHFDHSGTQTQLLLSHQCYMPVRQLYAVNWPSLPTPRHISPHLNFTLQPAFKSKFRCTHLFHIWKGILQHFTL